MITVKVSDLKNMVLSLEKDGIEYVDIEELEEDEVCGDEIPATLNFEGYDGQGGGVDYGGIEHIENVDVFYKCNE